MNISKIKKRAKNQFYKYQFQSWLNNGKAVYNLTRVQCFCSAYNFYKP